MSDQNSFESYVFSLSGSDFARLQNAVNERLDRERYGATSYEELALNEGRQAVCPFCGSTTHIDDGHTGSGQSTIQVYGLRKDIYITA